LQKPFDDAPPGEHDLTEIYDHSIWVENGKREWWVTVLFESLSGDYENNKSMVELGATWSDCQASVDSGNEEENLVLTYARGLPISDKDNKEFLMAVAKLAGKPAEDLFPRIKETSQSKPTTKKKPTTTKSKTTAKSKMTTTGHVMETIQTCDVDHKDYSNFKEEESDYYFREGAKWHGSKCRGEGCGKRIGIKDGNFKPRAGCPVYICPKYHLDKTNCAAMVCFDCVFKSSGENKSKRHRRGNNDKTNH